MNRLSPAAIAASSRLHHNSPADHGDTSENVHHRKYLCSAIVARFARSLSKLGLPLRQPAYEYVQLHERFESNLADYHCGSADGPAHNPSARIV
jgi:hypothetical protein